MMGAQEISPLKTEDIMLFYAIKGEKGWLEEQKVFAVETKPALKPEQNLSEFLMFYHFAFLSKLLYKQSYVCASCQ